MEKSVSLAPCPPLYPPFHHLGTDTSLPQPLVGSRPRDTCLHLESAGTFQTTFPEDRLGTAPPAKHAVCSIYSEPERDYHK